MSKQSFSVDLPLPGTVRPEWKRCGRDNCRCAAGSSTGRTFYRYWRQAGRLKKQYVKRERVQEVRERCEATSQARRQWRQGLRGAQEALAALRSQLRQVEASWRK